MSKGIAIERLERIKAAGVRRTVERRRALANAVGDAPFGSSATTPEQRARQYLPAYWNLGMARGPLAQQYWADMYKAHGPKAVTQFNKEMQRLLNSKYWHYAVSAAPPEIAQQGRWLRAQGLGPQQQPQAARPLAMPSMKMGGR